MKNIIIGSISLIFGLIFFLWLWKDSALKNSSGGSSSGASFRGYLGSILAILLGLTMIFREIYK
jgi:hypothetical protein